MKPSAGAGRPEAKPAKNVFIVDTTFQLLNAIEASHSISGSNNHLVVVNEAGQRSDAYRRLITRDDWETITFIRLYIDTDRCRFPWLGKRVAEVVRKWCGRLQHFDRLRRATALCRDFGEVDGLFLGHYWIDGKDFMRHFANTIRHRTLTILDDGTDIIETNKRRKAGAGEAQPPGSSAVSQRWRDRHWRWNTREAESVTFFTTYDIQVGGNDRLIKNDYRYLRALAGSATPHDAIYFLGQCLAEDGYLDLQVYLDYLKRVRVHFGDVPLLYIPHPRESSANVAEVERSAGMQVLRFDVPIEFELASSGRIPKAIASFFCSALESCAEIFGDRVPIVCFRIRSEDLKIERPAVDSIYDYFARKASTSFNLVDIGSSSPRHDARQARRQ